MKKTEILFALIDFELTGKKINDETKNSINSAVISDLTKITKAHDLSHLLADALYKLEMLSGDEEKELKKARKVALYRSECMKKDILSICDLLNKAKIPFILLKGARMRNYYPCDWMRTSCDIDALVKEEELERAIEALEKGNWKVSGEKAFHDISLYSENDTHLELHFKIKGGEELKEDLSDKVWDYSYLKEEGQYEYIQTNEYFLFHLLSHMATHFFSSGCGIKYFLDIYILKQKLEFNEEKLRGLLIEGQMEEFYKKILDLIDVWFGNGEYDDITKEMAKFILTGGIYGSKEHRIKNTQVKSSGKIKHIMKRIFMPYRALKKRYPVLEKHKYLTPLLEVVRWGNMIFKGRCKIRFKELNSIKNVSKEDFEKREKMLKGIGLLK